MNPFAPVFHYLLNVLKSLGGQLKIDAETFLKSFVRDDLGKLAIDAVEYVQASMPNADGAAKRNVAVQKFLTDAKAAGHDVETFALSTANWFIESALQAVKAGLVK